MAGIRAFLLFLSVLSVAFAQDKPGCELTCRDAMTGPQAAGLGCPAGDAACLCKNPEFHNGVRDCIAKSCAPNLVDGAIADINNTFCGAAAVPTPPATTPTPTPTPTPAPAPPSSVSSAAPPPAETSPPPAAQTTSTTPTSSSTTTPSPAPTSSLTSASSPASSSTTSSGTKNSAATTAPPAPTKSAAPEETGLSAGAKIGIGIGAAVAIVGLVGLLACVYFLRRKGGRNALSMHISDPLPGSGRIFAKDLPAQRPFRTDLGMTELELRSHPYEKMVPQQEPRTMV